MTERERKKLILKHTDLEVFQRSFEVAMSIFTFSSSKFAEFVFAFTPKELCPIAPGCERSELPGGNGSTAHVPQRGSVIGVSRMTQPFQGRWRMRPPSQGSPPARATLGYETQLIRSKDTSFNPELGTTHFEWLRHPRHRQALVLRIRKDPRHAGHHDEQP